MDYPEFLWVVANDSRHVPDRFTYQKPTEQVGDRLQEVDPWDRPVFVTKIVKYELVEGVSDEIRSGAV